jgi:hypothetical protein
MATNRWYTNSTNIIVDYTTAEASDVENKLNDVANALDAVEGEFDDLKEQSLKFNPSGGETPDTEYTGTLADMKETIVGFDSNGDMTLYPGDESGFVWDGNVTRIDIDGATDIGADLTDADLIVVDDGATGTNRKSALSRVWTWLKGKTDAPIGMLDVKGGTDIGGALYETDLVVVADPASGAVRKSALSRIWTFLKTMVDAPVSMIDIDGATDIGAELADGDLIVVDDGASGTNRKATMDRLFDYQMARMNLPTESLLANAPNLITNAMFNINERGWYNRTYAPGEYGSHKVMDRWVYEHGTSKVSMAVAFFFKSTLMETWGGSINLVRFIMTNAAGGLGAAEYIRFAQYIEGITANVVQFGTTRAKPLSLSFWMHCHTLAASTTYRIGFSLRGGKPTTNVTRSCTGVFEFTTNSLGSWEGYVTYTFPRETAGTDWQTNLKAAVDLGICLGAGSTYTSPSDGVWHESNYLAGPTATDFTAINGATFYFGSVSLVPGSVPLPAEISAGSYDIDKLRCKRYVNKIIYHSSEPEIWNCGTGVGYKRDVFDWIFRTTPACSWQGAGAGLDFQGYQLGEAFPAYTISSTPTMVIHPEGNGGVLMSFTGAHSGGFYGLHSALGSILVGDADLIGYA